VKIIKAQKQHALTIAEFNVAMALETENKIIPPEKIIPGVESLMEKPHYGFYIIAEHENEITGCMMITYEWTDWRNGLFWWIQSVFVKKEYRQKGIYRAMHEFVRKEAKKHEEVVGIRLYVEKDNKNAQQVYHKMGMKETDYKLFEEMI
jgi:ribosomal protein S18 acetylase RimI-like enzyme